MDLNNVTTDDGKACAQLLNLLKAGRWELSGKDITAYNDTVKWVHALAVKMAERLRTPAAASSPSSESFSIKSMGSLPVAAPRKASKKK